MEEDAPRLAQYVGELFAEQLPFLFRRDRAPTVDDERAFIRSIAASDRSLLLYERFGFVVEGRQAGESPNSRSSWPRTLAPSSLRPRSSARPSPGAGSHRNGS